MGKLKLGFVAALAICAIGVLIRYIFQLDAVATVVTGIGFVILVIVAAIWLVNAKRESLRIAAQRKAEKLDEEEE